MAWVDYLNLGESPAPYGPCRKPQPWNVDWFSQVMRLSLEIISPSGELIRVITVEALTSLAIKNSLI